MTVTVSPTVSDARRARITECATQNLNSPEFIGILADCEEMCEEVYVRELTGPDVGLHRLLGTRASDVKVHVVARRTFRGERGNRNVLEFRIPEDGGGIPVICPEFVIQDGRFYISSVAGEEHPDNFGVVELDSRTFSWHEAEARINRTMLRQEHRTAAREAGLLSGSLTVEQYRAALSAGYGYAIGFQQGQGVTLGNNGDFH